MRWITESLATLTEEGKAWDEHLAEVQFSINNTVHRTTKRIPSELLLGYKPRQPSDAKLQAEVQIVQALDDINQIRDETPKRISSDQVQQK